MKKFENIVIATDLDGTFFGSDATPVERNLKAIEYFIQNGGKFTIATGRALQNVTTPFATAEEYVNLPMVVCNGACVYDLQKKKAIEKVLIPFEIIERLYHFVQRHFSYAGIRASGVDVGFITTEEQMENPYILMDYQKRGADAEKIIAPIDEWRSFEIIKLVVRIDPSVRDEIIEAVAKEFGDELFATFSSDSFLDIQLKGINKGEALVRTVKNTLGEKAVLYACGDYINDLEMMGLADVSVCPSNAHEHVKAACDLCLCSNDEGVIADLIEYLDKRKGN